MRGKADRAWGVLGTFACVAAAWFVLPAGAGALTVGADLNNRPANATYGCEITPGINAFGGRLFLPNGQSSCTYMPTGRLGDTSEGTAAPSGASVATRVRVKTGNVVGPMRITVSRQIGGTTTGFTCCHFAGQSQVFTPRRNGITTVPVRLPLLSEVDGVNGLITQDYLAISVLRPGIPIPAQEIGNPGNISNPGAGGFFPHLGPGQSRVDMNGLGGVQPLIRAEVTPICSGAGAAASIRDSGGAGVSAGTGCAPPMATRVADRRGSKVRIPLLCNVTVPCRGRLVLQNRRSPNAAVVSAKRRTYAAGSFRLGSGEKGATRIELKRPGKRLLKRKKQARVWANITFKTASGKIVASQKLKLKR